ncbi:GA-binding protein subunit beta-2-like isoform X2 [Branchiostoma lanceolatum]|uniref:GA-binding protein subunit beta-2-like isoform X2 n=1 Tax=Branchiostoma lanceolatum TaxID=7740 RepID=UPI0034546EB9
MASASAEETSNQNGANYFLLYAAENGILQGVEEALKAGADIDFDHVHDEVDYSSGTALNLASRWGHVDVVKLLLHRGASMAKRCRDSIAPLHAAAAEGRTEVVELLVYHGATVDIRDALQNTPLMTACYFNHVDTVRRLIELGAKADMTDDALAKSYGISAEKLDCCGESVKLIREARKTKLLRCCNPKCGKPGYRKTLKLCAGCKLTRYCGRDCQKQHWSVGHKKCCGQDAFTDEGPVTFQEVFTKLMADEIREQEHMKQA